MDRAETYCHNTFDCRGVNLVYVPFYSAGFDYCRCTWEDELEGEPGSCGYVAPRRVDAPHRRRWNTIDMGRMLAAPAARDRAASRPLSVLGTAFVAQVAAGRSENGGGSRGRFGLVFGEEKKRTFGFPTRR